MAKRKDAMYSMYNNRNGMLFMSSEKVASLKRLEDIQKLEDDWNGYGARAFSSVLIEKCRLIIDELDPQPKIFPTGRQSIQLQYELDDRSYLEFEIFKDKTMCLEVPQRVYSDAVTLLISENEKERIRDIVENFHNGKSAELRAAIQGNKTLSTGYYG
ncbi:MAG: hypothetical protein LUF30_04120 [Lachnospiraceae bacterium]|nr:hypothetical protein [Lachnospiraceae bacterium]